MSPNRTGVAVGFESSALTRIDVPGVLKIAPRGEVTLKKFPGRSFGAAKLSGTPSQLISRRPDANDPATFGFPAGADDGVRTDLMLAHNVRYLTSFEPDFEALRRAPTRIVLAVGQDSNGNLAQRGGEAAAERLGQEAIRFPGDHGGFMGGEYGQPPGKPVEFAAKLRAVLAGA